MIKAAASAMVVEPVKEFAPLSVSEDPELMVLQIREPDPPIAPLMFHFTVAVVELMPGCILKVLEPSETGPFKVKLRLLEFEHENLESALRLTAPDSVVLTPCKLTPVPERLILFASEVPPGSNLRRPPALMVTSPVPSAVGEVR